MAPALKTFRNGVWRDLADLQVFRSGAWRRLKTLKVYSGGAWRQIASFVPALVLSAAGSKETFEDAYHHPVTFWEVVATPSGGVAPYSYAWSVVSGSGAVTNPTAASSSVSGVGSVVFRCTCTDSAGQTATADVTLPLS